MYEVHLVDGTVVNVEGKHSFVHNGVLFITSGTRTDAPLLAAFSAFEYVVKMG